MSVSRTGIKHTLESRINRSIKAGGKPFLDEVGNIFYTNKQAAEFHGIHKTAVRNVLIGRCKAVDGHKFYYLDGSSPVWDDTDVKIKMSRSHGGRPIKDENGVCYFSVADASRKLGMAKANIRLVLKGKYKQCNGHTFTYADE